MKPNPKYRFSTLGACSGDEIIIDEGVFLTFIGDTTRVDISVVDNSLVNTLVYLSGFDDKINGVQTVTKVGTNFIRFTLNYVASSLNVNIVGSIMAVAWRYVNPLNFYNTKFKWAKDGVRWRMNLEGSLKFVETDYQYFKGILLNNPCCENKFRIERYCGGAWTDYWMGYFTDNMGRWDIDKCAVEFKFLPDDAYRCIDQNKDRKHNVMQVDYTWGFEVPYEIYTELSEECCSDVYNALYGPATIPGTECLGTNAFQEDENPWPSCGLDRDIWQPYTQVVTRLDAIDVNGVAATSMCIVWIREYTITLDAGGIPSPPEGEGWVIDTSTTISGFAATRWVRKPFNGTYEDDQYFTLTMSDECTVYTKQWNILPTLTTTQTRGRTLADVLSFIQVNTCSKILGIRSDFFEINPPGDTPGYIAGKNYITGLDNKIANLQVFNVSDFVNPTATSPAVIAYLTFSEIINALVEMFNCDWFIDADGYLRIEHIFWFSKSNAIDAMAKDFEGNYTYNKGKGVFEYDREKIPNQEEYQFFIQSNIDFRGLPILYYPPCAGDSTISHTVSKFTTDVSYALNNPTSITLENFIMVCVDGGTIDVEIGVLTGQLKNNVHLSWANLHANYHKYDRPLPNGNMNGAYTTFFSTRRSKIQKGIVYQKCCTMVNPTTDLVITTLGNGEIAAMEMTTKDDMYRFELLHS